MNEPPNHPAPPAAGRGTIRPATPADVPAIRRVLAAHGNDGPIVGADIVGPYVRHLIAHHRSLVVDEDGELVAFGAVADAGVAHHLADLFVAPERLGQGHGARLLDALLEGLDVRTTFASDDPRALPLYVRAGMTPVWPQLYLEGSASLLPPTAAQLTTADATADELAGLERRWRGVDRPADHAYWASAPEADAFTVRSDGEPIALAYARIRQPVRARNLGRVVGRPDVDPVPPILVALRRAARDLPLDFSLPGPNPALPVLLAAGFRVVDRDTAMESRPGLIDPTRFLPDPGLL